MKGQCCFNRWSSHWWLMPTGKPKKDEVAYCDFTPDFAAIEKMLPASMVTPSWHRVKIHADSGSDCPVFEEKTK